MEKWRGILGWLPLGLILTFFVVGGQTARAQEQTSGQKSAAGLTHAAELISLLGKVEIKSPQEAAFRPAKLKDPLNAGDQVRTLEKSRAKIWFRDETVLILNENTTMEITQFQASATGRSEKSRLKVFEGAMRFILSKVSTQGPRNLEIEGKTAIMGIRGTDGVIETHSPDNVYHISGTNPMTVMDKASRQTINLNPMQHAVVQAGKPISVGPVTPQMLKQITAQYRVASVFVPSGSNLVNPPIPPAMFGSQTTTFGNPLINQTNTYKQDAGGTAIPQSSLPTIHQGSGSIR